MNTFLASFLMICMSFCIHIGKKAKVVIERARDSIAAMVGGASHGTYISH